MEPIPAKAAELVWESEGALRRAWTLTSHGARVARLSRRGMSRVAEVEAAARAWRLEPKGWVSRRFDVVDDATGAPVAATTNAYRSEVTLTFSDGSAYLLRRESWWRQDLVVCGPDGQPVMRLELEGFWRKRGRVTLHVETLRPERTLLLASVAWLLVVLRLEASGAAAAV